MHVNCSHRKDISEDQCSVVHSEPREMECQHKSEENIGQKGRKVGGGVRVNIRYTLLSRGRKMGGSEFRFYGVILCLLLLLLEIQTAQANRPPRFVLDGNVGSEIVVRMMEGEGVRGGGGSFGEYRVLR